MVEDYVKRKHVVFQVSLKFNLRKTMFVHYAEASVVARTKLIVIF